MHDCSYTIIFPIYISKPSESISFFELQTIYYLTHDIAPVQRRTNDTTGDDSDTALPATTTTTNDANVVSIRPPLIVC